MIRVLRLAALVLTVLSAAWALRLILFGGIRLVVAGLLIRSSDYWRPIEIGAAAAIVFFAAGGRSTILAAWRAYARAWDHPSPRAARWMAFALTATVFVVTLTYQATTCGGSDTSGYMSQANRWLQGTTAPALPLADAVPWPNAAWSFTPLGYTPNLDGPPYRMAPIYAPGLPWLLAAATLVNRHAGMSGVEPLSCALLVLAAFGIGRRVRGPWTGVVAAWLMATSPILLYTSMTTMSDVPAGAAWAGAFYFLIAPGAWPALAAGLAAGVAITIRPNLVFLAAIMMLWFAMCPEVGSGRPRRRRLIDASCFVLGVVPGILAVALVNDRWYGSPFASGYGSLSRFFEMSHVWPNLVGYTRSLMDSEPVLIVAAIVGFVVSVVRTRGLPRRAMLLAALLVAAVIAEYLAYLVFGDWSFLRFLVIIWALLGVAAAVAIASLLRNRSAVVGAVAIAAVLAVGGYGVWRARAHNAFGEPFDRRYAATGKIVSDIVPARAVVFSFMHSGSLRYYSGRVPIRWDVFGSDWLDRAVEWLSSQGVQTYAVLETWELHDFRERFAGQRAVAATDVPVAVYRSYDRLWTVYVFNLSSPPPLGTRPIEIEERDPSRWRNWPPGPEPTLTLTGGK